MTEVSDKKKDQGTTKTAVIAMAIFVALSGVLLVITFFTAGAERLPDAATVVGVSRSQTASQSVAAVQNASDLDTITVEIDKSDLETLDTELNQIDTDSSAF